MMYVYVPAFISSVGVYILLCGGHGYLTIRLEHKPKRGATVDVWFLFIYCILRLL